MSASAAAAAAAAAATATGDLDGLFGSDDEPAPDTTSMTQTSAMATKTKTKKKKKKTKTKTKTKTPSAKKTDTAGSGRKKKKGTPGKRLKKKTAGTSASTPAKKKKKKKPTGKKTSQKKVAERSRFVDDEAAVDGTAGDDEDDDADDDSGSLASFIDDGDDVVVGGAPAPFIDDEELIKDVAVRATETMRPAQRAAAPANARPKKATPKLLRQQTMLAVTLTSDEHAAKTDIAKWTMLPVIMNALASKKRLNPDIPFSDALAHAMIQKMMGVAEYVLTKKFANATPEECIGLLSIPTQSIQLATADAFQTIQQAIRGMFPDAFGLDHHFFHVVSSMLATMFACKGVTIDEIPDDATPICQWTGDALTLGQNVYLCAYYRKTATGSTVSSFYISHHAKFAPLYLLFIQAARGMHRWVWSFALSLLEWQRTMSMPKEASDEVRIKRFLADDTNVPFVVASAVMNFFEATDVFSKISLTP